MPQTKTPLKNPYLLHLLKSFLNKKILGLSMGGNHNLPINTLKIMAETLNNDVSTVRNAINIDNPTDKYLKKLIELFCQGYYLDWADFVKKEENEFSKSLDNIKKGFSDLRMNEKFKNYYIEINLIVEQRINDIFGEKKSLTEKSYNANIPLDYEKIIFNNDYFNNNISVKLSQELYQLQKQIEINTLSENEKKEFNNKIKFLKYKLQSEFKGKIEIQKKDIFNLILSEAVSQFKYYNPCDDNWEQKILDKIKNDDVLLNKVSYKDRFLNDINIEHKMSFLKKIPHNNNFKDFFFKIYIPPFHASSNLIFKDLQKTTFVKFEIDYSFGHTSWLEKLKLF